MKEKKYPGFGVEKSVTGWVNFLGLPYATVWRHLNEGMTPEEIATIKGLTIDMSRLREPSQRDKDRMEEIERKIYDILDRSDYDPDGIVIGLSEEGRVLTIVWNDVPIGVYNYQKDVLHLTGGDSLHLRYPTVADLMIYKNDIGKWEIHPNTKIEIYEKKFN